MSLTTLIELLDSAELLCRESPSWLLEASFLSEAIGESVLGDPDELAAVRAGVRRLAESADCDIIVGASKAADRIVRGLNTPSTPPSRALVFELVRVTGSTIAQATDELRHVDVVPAALLDMQVGYGASQVLPVQLD